MEWTKAIRSSIAARVLTVSAVLLLAFGVFGLAVLLSNTHGAATVAGHARSLHWTNATLGASGIARAAVAQAVFFSYDDVSSDEGSRRAIDEAVADLAAVAELSESPLAPQDGPLLESLHEFVAMGTDVVAQAESGNPAGAEALRLAAAEPAYEFLESQLTRRQADLAVLIENSERTAGMISRVTFVAISFVIPATTMVIYWFLLRHRMRRREEAMQDRLEDERALNKAKDEFIAGLSHELRTPLTTIVGFSQLLIESADLNTDDKEQLMLIHSSSADLTRMVEDLLVAARIDAGALSVHAEPLDLRDEIEIATSSYLLTGVSIDIQVPSIDVYADALHVRQIIHNLVSNAIRHGGDRILISASRRDTMAALVVADDGPGAPPELEERLFRRFVHHGRQALVAGSVGLGLAISSELAKRMGGVLRYSRVNGWTTFSLTIPLAPMAAEDAREHVLAQDAT